MTMTYEALAATKNTAYRHEATRLIKAAISVADVAALGADEKLDALYEAKRALNWAMEIARAQQEMQRKFGEKVEWTIQEVVTTCRDMDGDCDACPLYNEMGKRCFRARDNGIAGGSTPASWDLEYSPELKGTPAGNWIEAFRDAHSCECCPSHGGHCDITGNRRYGRCNCKLTEIPAEWRTVVGE